MICTLCHGVLYRDCSWRGIICHACCIDWEFAMNNSRNYSLGLCHFCDCFVYGTVFEQNTYICKRCHDEDSDESGNLWAKIRHIVVPSVITPLMSGVISVKVTHINLTWDRAGIVNVFCLEVRHVGLMRENFAGAVFHFAGLNEWKEMNKMDRCKLCHSTKARLLSTNKICVNCNHNAIGIGGYLLRSRFFCDFCGCLLPTFKRTLGELACRWCRTKKLWNKWKIIALCVESQFTWVSVAIPNVGIAPNVRTIIGNGNADSVELFQASGVFCVIWKENACEMQIVRKFTFGRLLPILYA